MSDFHLGINLGHDRAAALVSEGEIVVAIHQERLDRRKHSVGFLHQSASDPTQVQLPDEAIRYCLEYSGISLAELASVTANMPGVDYGPDILRRKLPPELADKVLRVPSHHLAHAYTAYWPSGFDDALVLVVDASGNVAPDRRTESYTLYEAHGGKLTEIYRHAVPSHLASLSTLGFVYEYVSRKAAFATEIGGAISVPEAGKLMGLAPYGGLQPQWHRWFGVRDDSYEIGISAYDIFLEIAALEKCYDDGKGKPYLRPYLVDLAYKVQTELEEALRHVVGRAVRETGLRKVCLAGGVALNSVANYKLLNDLNLEDIFIFPAAGDAGVAAGCALWANATQQPDCPRPVMRQATLGRAYGSDVIQHAIAQFGDSIQVETLTSEETVSRTAEALAKGHIVARVEGRCEYGPRALGHRSIMADPNFEEMKAILNARVKFREAFRPFAPVIPEENISEVFAQNIASPFMLLVSPIKEEYREKIPAVTHYDGTGRVQTVTRDENPFFYAVCQKLPELRDGPPVLLNTSFNVAGQPIVETPEEAISTFLGTDIDYLCLENLWISKPGVPVRSYEEHLKLVGESPMPHGLGSTEPSVIGLMRQLDRALFQGETEGCAWAPDELKELSAKGARFKETSALFPENPFGRAFRTQLSEDVVLLLDPLGRSRMVDNRGIAFVFEYSLDEVRLLMAVLADSPEPLAALRIEQQFTTLEWDKRVEWAVQQLAAYRLEPGSALRQPAVTDSQLPESQQNVYALEGMAAVARAAYERQASPRYKKVVENGQTLAPFADPEFSAFGVLGALRTLLEGAGYHEKGLCSLLGVKSLQLLEPTHFHYYDRFKLPRNDLGDLVRFLLLRVAMKEERLNELLGESCCDALIRLGLIVKRGSLWASRVQIYTVDGLYIATDHRFLVFEEDRLTESPVMYIGLDSMGLVHTAPRYSGEKVLDLCSGSGIQALVASRYARDTVGIDLNPRAIRFARFNAQLNGIRNAQFIEGDLYSAVPGQAFDVILANPPFVPSPEDSLKFRDGGAQGENVLSKIVADAASHLKPTGKLHIVTDLVDVGHYQEKLDRWWRGGPAHKLVLQTADRDDMQFSVPHSHAPFGQSFQDYNEQLERWVNNFHSAGISAVNFGYILIHRLPESAQSSYYRRTIHNPNESIHSQVNGYFEQRALLGGPDAGKCYLRLNDGIRFRVEYNLGTPTREVEVYCPDNPYYTTYVVSEEMIRVIKAIALGNLRWASFQNKNKAWLLDLIYKGILLLSRNPKPKASGPDRRRFARATGEKKPVIKEMQTETTPTCLSSYL